MGRLVGIDLGTTNSVVAVLEGGEPVVIPLADGSRLCPSVVGFSKSGERLVGQLAKRQAITNPDRTIASIKRHMGSAYTVAIDDKAYTPQEISAMVLQKLKTDAEAFLGDKVEKAVITVPAYFNDSQRQATKDAGQIAGLEVLRILNEPTAAALAYGMEKTGVHTILVWDLGGGTFDVSILEVGEGVFEVKSTNGDTHLGGDDWDECVMNWLASEFMKQTGVDLKKDKMAVQRLKDAAEKAKIELSSLVTTNVNLPFLSTTADGPVHLDLNLTRAQFEALTDELRYRMLDPTKQALEDAGMKASEIDKVVLVGGSTRMPAVQDMVREMFEQEPHRGINPDEVVALGAAVQAGILGGEVRDIVLLDVTPLSLGLETQGGVMTRLIPRNTTIPTSKTERFTTAADGQTAVDIHILQGEREFANANKSLGRFTLGEIPPAPRGLPKIEVTFEIDANGIVHVSAMDKATGKAASVTVTASTGLSKSDIDKMVKEATLHAEEDKRLREQLEAKNKADSVLHNAEKTMKEAEGRIAVSILQTAQDAMAVLRKAVSSDMDAETLRQKTETVTETVYSVSTALYQAKVAGLTAAPPPEPEPAETGTIDEDSSDRTTQFTPPGYASDGPGSEPDISEDTTVGATTGEFRNSL